MPFRQAAWAIPGRCQRGIAEALIATVAGLCVGYSVAHRISLSARPVERIVVGMEKQAMRMADAVESSPARGRAAA